MSDYGTGGNTKARLPSHVCNCIGCCPKCGTCRTWPGHTASFCALIQRQMVERREWTCKP